MRWASRLVRLPRRSRQVQLSAGFSKPESRDELPSSRKSCTGERTIAAWLSHMVRSTDQAWSRGNAVPMYSLTSCAVALSRVLIQPRMVSSEQVPT